jgi:hypothetical protein
MSFVPRIGVIPVNSHRTAGLYNGEECDPDDPSATLRHFYGTDVMAAVTAAGRLNGRSYDQQAVRDMLSRAIATFGPVREVYFTDTTLEVTVSFGDEVHNRLWIGSGSINSYGQLHTAQYLNPAYKNIWTLALVDGPRRTSTARTDRPAATRTCGRCFLQLPLSPVETCPNCGAPVSQVTT